MNDSPVVRKKTLKKTKNQKIPKKTNKTKQNKQTNINRVKDKKYIFVTLQSQPNLTLGK